MTSAPKNPEHELGQNLARQAERFTQHGGSPLQLDQVLSRAGEIRRARRMRASIAMAAVVLAVAVPVGITTLGSGDPTRSETPGFAQSPSQPPTRSDERPVGLGRYATGDAPATGYVQDGTLYFAGTERQVGTNVNYLQRLTDGFLVGRFDDGGNVTVRFVADQGESPSQTWTLAAGIAVSPSGMNGAFIETDGTVILVRDGGATISEIAQLPTGTDFSYETVAVSDGDCASGDPCSVWAVTTGPEQTAWKITSDGEASPVPELEGLIAVDGSENVVRQIASDDFGGGTYAMFDREGRELWRTSELVPKSFSPNGRYLIADLAGSDGNALQVTLLDSVTGRAVVDLKTATSSAQGAQVSIFEMVWEDDTHVLATVTEGEKYAVVRVDLAGNREYAVGVQGGGDPFALDVRLG